MLRYRKYIIIGLLFLIFFMMESSNKVQENYLDQPPVYWPLDYKYGESNVGNIQSVDSNENTLFTAHPRRLVCSHDQNEWVKHVRLNEGGGIMYVSNNSPTEYPSCKLVQCPPLIKDSWTLKDKSHYNPYPLRDDKLKCWQCIA